MDHAPEILLVDSDPTARERLASQGAEGELKAQVAKQERELAALKTIADLVNRLDDPQGILAQVLEQVLAITELEIGSVWILDSPRQELVLVAQHGYPPGFLDGLDRLQQDQGLPGRIIQRAEMLISATHPPQAKRGKQAGFRFLAGIPLSARNRNMGVMILTTRTGRVLSASEIELLTAMSNQAAIAIHNATLHTETQCQAESLRRLAERLQTISEVGLLMQRTLNLDQVFQTVGQGLQSLGFHCSVLLLDSAGENLILRYTNWWPQLTHAVEKILGIKISGMSLPVDQMEALRRVVRERQVVWVDDPLLLARQLLPRLPISLFRQAVKRVRLGRGVGFPLTGRKRVIGMLAIWAEKLTESDAAAFSALTSQTAVSIENVRLFAQTQAQLESLEKQTRQITTIGEITEAILSHLDTDSLARIALERMRQIIPSCQVAYLILPDRGRGTVTIFSHPAGHTSGDFALADFRFDPRTIRGEIVQHIDTSPPPHVPALVRQLAAGMRSHMAFPLIVRDKLMGTLDLTSERPDAFGPEAATIGQEVAGHLAVAVENAQLYAGQERQVEELAALYRTSLDVAGELTLPSLLQAIVERATALLNADRGALFLEQDSKASFTPFVTSGMEKSAAQSWIPLVEKLSVRHVGLSLPSSTSPVEHNLGVPLIWNERTMGVIIVGRAAGKQVFDQDQSRLLALFGAQAAAAIERARLYNALERSKAQLHALVERLITAQEEERRILAYNLHDGLTQDVVAADLQLQTFRFLRSADPEAAEEALKQGLASLQKSVVEARRLIADLGPAGLDELGLVAAVDTYAREIGVAAGWQVDFQASHSDFGFSQSQQIAIYRIAQEALSNVRKHANTDRVKISLLKKDDVLEVAVRDWGQGFDPAAVAPAEGGGGVGLTAMRERAALLDATCEIESAPGRGTTVRVNIPLV